MTAALAVGNLLAVAGTASAQDAPVHAPRAWEMGLPAPGSPVARAIDGLHDMVMVIITVISLLVAGLLLWVAWRYSAKRNPVPSQTSHNTLLEVAWTVIPVLILVVIAIPSFRLVYFEDRTHDADMTVKVTGHQWYWEYTYPDQQGINFSSRIIPENELKPGQLRLLAVDEQLVVPAGKNIRILTTSADVIHSFYIPSLGVQRYAIPGRTIETWVRVDKPGVYYGECNQICGTNHSQMPISIRAVTPAEFTAWVAEAKKKYAEGDAPAPAGQPIRLAAADAGAPVASLSVASLPVAQIQH
ncbi:MAG: cytochrome c oxidase subunit II [Rhodospirillales bacterium]|nr:cytochrome c oxidase subunit II [Rhodospirillales bacterium]